MSLFATGPLCPGSCSRPTQTPQEKLAANQLCDYVNRMTGATLSVQRSEDMNLPPDGPFVAIGRPATHPVLRELQAGGLISVELIRNRFSVGTDTRLLEPV